MKEARASKSLLDDLPKRIIDQNSETLHELTREGYTYAAIRRVAREMVEAGKWEPVWKIVRNRIVPSFRRKKVSNL